MVCGWDRTGDFGCALVTVSHDCVPYLGFGLVNWFLAELVVRVGQTA